MFNKIATRFMKKRKSKIDSKQASPRIKQMWDKRGLKDIFHTIIIYQRDK